MAQARRKPLYSFWTPRYWPIWLGMGLLRLCCLLPYNAQMAIGKSLGRLLHRVAGTRRAIVRRNIELCFPELSAKERNELAQSHFESLGASLMEMGLGRWGSKKTMLAISEVHGVEHVSNALAAGRGVILLGAHFTCIEACGPALLEKLPPFDAVQRSNKNPLITEIFYTGRLKSTRRLIEKTDMKGMIRSLRAGVPVWYAPDQSYSGKQSAVVPLFGVPSMANTATNSLAKLGNAVVIPLFQRRLPQGGYRMDILPPLDGFPSEDPVVDTRQYHKVLEDYIRLCPEQYYWVHRKFKNLPPPLDDYYADLDALK